MSTPAVADSERRAFLDAVLADAERRSDHSRHLANDPHAWRGAIIDLLDETRSTLSGVNADLKACARPRKAMIALGEERAALAERQSLLEVRLRYVKTLIEALPPPVSETPSKPPRPAPPTVDSENPIEAARAHLYAALDLLRSIEESAT